MNKTKRIRNRQFAERLAALEKERRPPRQIEFCWVPSEPCAPDEELVVTQETQTGNGWFRTISKRKKQK
jgi:hypothetical protein